MVLKFTPEVEITIDETNSSVAHAALSEISQKLQINYEVWIDQNQSRIKDLTALVPDQKLNFKSKINDIWYNMVVTLTDTSIEGLDAVHISEGAEPYELQLTVEEFTVSEEDQTVSISATGVLYCD